MDHADIRGKRLFAPRRGVHALNAMRAAIDDVQPSPTYSDHSAAATELSGANSLLRASTPCTSSPAATRFAASRHAMP